MFLYRQDGRGVIINNMQQEDDILVLRVAAKVVLESQGGILALHPSAIDLNRNWQMPGGIRDDIRESIMATAAREVLEETGIDITGLRLRPFKVGEWTAVDKGENVKILAVFMHVRLAARPAVTLSEEHDQFVWLDLANYKNYSANYEVVEIIEELITPGEA